MQDMQTNTIQLDNKKISVFYQSIGFLFFGTLIFMAAYFYKEREFFIDQSYYDVRLLISGGLNNMDLGRYSAVINMILPWIALKMGLSLKAILICNSIDLIIFNYGIFLFITLKLKNNGASLAVLLSMALASTQVFYIPMSLLNEILVLGVLLWALIHPETPSTSDKEKRFGTIGALVAVVLLTFYHPLTIFLIFFVIGLEATAFKRYRDSQLWIIALVSVGLFILKEKVLFPNSYDEDKIVPVSTIIHELPGIKTWPITMYLHDFIICHFRALKWLFIICVLFTLRKGILFFLFTVLFIGGFTLIFMGSFYKGASALLVYEIYFSIYGFFTAILFICLFYTPTRKNLLLLISLPLLWIGVKKMYNAHEQFTYRVSYLSRIINEARKNGEKKCFIDYRCYPYVYGDTPWSVAYETLLCSSIPGPDSSVTIFIKDPTFDAICNTPHKKDHILFGAYFYPFQFYTDSIPDKYFRLPAGEYQYLTSPQNDTSFHTEIFSSKNVKIIPLEQTINVHLYDYTAVIDLKIENTSGKTLPAIPRKNSPVQLCYTMYDDGANKMGVGTPCAFETDIKDGSVCGLIVYLPYIKGTYFVKPDIITGDSALWNLPSPMVKIVVN